MRRGSPSVAEALRVLSLLADHVPLEVRASFRAALRAQGVAEPSDYAAAPSLPRAWSRPDIYALSFAIEVLPVLAAPERAAAVAALAVLSGGPPARRARPGGPETPNREGLPVPGGRIGV